VSPTWSPATPAASRHHRRARHHAALLVLHAARGGSALRPFDAILVPFDSYDDRAWERHADRDLDLNYLMPLLRVTDLPRFVLSYPSWGNRGRAAEAVLLKGLVYQNDFQAFLASPRTRLQFVRLQRSTRGMVLRCRLGPPQPAGMSVDWNAKTVTLPAWLPPEKRRETEHILLEDTKPISADYTSYRRQWLGAILDRYRGTRTRFIFLRLPRGPVVRPDLPPPDPIAWLVSSPPLAAPPSAEHMFDSLERPELFGDALHLNEEGGYEFSMMLAGESAACSPCAGCPLMPLPYPAILRVLRGGAGAVLCAAPPSPPLDSACRQLFLYMCWNAKFVLLIVALTASITRPPCGCGVFPPEANARPRW